MPPFSIGSLKIALEDVLNFVSKTLLSCLNIHKGKPKEAEPHVGVEVTLPNIVGLILFCKDEQAIPAVVWYP